ncbi:MAG: hypothetical protein ABI282_03800 [Candidatus Baltobacteraceae bacterium]
MSHHGLLLVFAVIAVGVLHTLVPDHWAPIALLARQRGWSAMQTARAASTAGLGHTVSTLAIGLVVWVAGVGFAMRFGHFVSIAASLALTGFGLWIAISSWREIRAIREHQGHLHHEHLSPERSRTALLLILGSSPMVEGIPTFFAAAKFGVGLIAVMAFFFALSTIATYVVLCTYSAAALGRFSLGKFEEYGEVVSGAFIAGVGIVFLLWPIA